ncbi:MAG: hypothetical protein ABI411_03185 [Tahibacter sp.]
MFPFVAANAELRVRPTQLLTAHAAIVLLAKLRKCLRFMAFVSDEYVWVLIFPGARPRLRGSYTAPLASDTE